jgi:hypothetical protein
VLAAIIMRIVVDDVAIVFDATIALATPIPFFDI